MIRFARSATLLVLTLALGACDAQKGPYTLSQGWPELDSPVPADPALDARVEELLGRMSLEEKVGQIIQADVRRVTGQDIRDYHLGSVLNGGGGFPDDDKYATVADWLELADTMFVASTDTADGGTGIPVIWGVDAVHGHNNVIGATLFPHNIGLGAARDPALLERIGEVTAREIRVTGHDWNFSPTVAVPRDDRWGRTYEGYSEDPEIVREYAAAMVRGLQGEPGSEGFLRGEHVIATAKHFIGDGGTAEGVDQGETVATEQELRVVHGPGYVSALEAGVQAVMASFSSWNGVKMHANHGLLTEVLKDTLGFDGILVGDWNAHGQIPGCTNQSCPTTINAGLDMFMVPDDWKALYQATLEQARTGEIPAERLDDAVRRILRVKARAGVLDAPRPSERPLAGDTTVLGAREHREVARAAVRGSLVLLKNNGSVLPLSPGADVLVLGEGADDIGKQAGGWTLTWQGTGNVNADFPGATSIWDGIREVVSGAGGQARLAPEGTFDAAAPPEVAIVVFGEDPYAEYQGDRDDVDYAGRDPELLATMAGLRDAGVPVVSVFLTGRPLWVNPELNRSDAFVVAWLPGSEGDGVADVLFTDEAGEVRYDFTGRLSFSWPRSPDQTPLNVGDDDYDPLFAYGYGLEYGSTEAVPELSESDRSGATEASFLDGSPVPPWSLGLQAGDGPLRPVTTGRVESEGGEITVSLEDRRVQGDSRRIEWSGRGAGRVLLASDEPVDLSAAGAALAWDIRRDEGPGGSVDLVVRHVGPDGGTVETRLEVTALVEGLPVGEWRTVRIGLDCLTERGTDLERVLSPWALETADALILGVSDIRLEAEADGAGCE